MKNLLSLSLLFLTVLSSCSTDDSSDTPDDKNTGNIEEKFQLEIDGEQLPVITWHAAKAYNTIVLIGETADQRAFDFTMNTNGVLSEARYYSNDLNIDFVDYDTSYYYPSKTFEISNFIFDESNKTIQFSFKGALFSDDFDVNSDRIFVDNGIVVINYVESNLETDVENTYITATIGGEKFESVKGSTSGIDAITLFGNDDGPMSLGIRFDEELVEKGSYTFTDANSIFGIVYDYFDPYDDVSKEYNTSGTLIIEELVKPDGIFFRGYIKGSFKATAMDLESGEEIAITNGTFSQYY